MIKSLMFSLLATVYCAFAAVPLEWFWFNPGDVKFTTVKEGETPKLHFYRDIKRDVRMFYSVTVRDEFTVACEGHSNPFGYKKTTGYIREKDLVWWANGDQRCSILPTGFYTVETCWSAPRPLDALLPDRIDGAIGWLLPKKTTCRHSEFEIMDAI